MEESRWKEEEENKERGECVVVVGATCGDSASKSYIHSEEGDRRCLFFFFILLSFFSSIRLTRFIQHLFRCIFARLPLSFPHLFLYVVQLRRTYFLILFVFPLSSSIDIINDIHFKSCLLLSTLYSYSFFSQRWERPDFYPVHFNGGFLDSNAALFRI